MWIRVACKACPRCAGDLALSQDQFGWFWHCVQCAREYNLDLGHRQEELAASI